MHIFTSESSEFSIVAGLIAEVLFKLFFERLCDQDNETKHEAYWLMSFLLINGCGTCVDENDVCTFFFFF